MKVIHTINSLRKKLHRIESIQFSWLFLLPSRILPTIHDLWHKSKCGTVIDDDFRGTVELKFFK